MRAFIAILAVAAVAHGGYIQANSHQTRASSSYGFAPVAVSAPSRSISSGYAPSFAPVSSHQSSYTPVAAPAHGHHHSQVSSSSHSLDPRFITASAPAHHSGPRVHEIRLESARPVIRVEEHSRPQQVIRVHEAPQSAPEVVRVQAPAEQQALIRVIARNAGPAHVERVVHQTHGIQYIDVHKPAPAPARIVQVIRGAAAPPRVEFILEQAQDEVHVADSPDQQQLPAPQVVASAPAPAPLVIAAPSAPAHAPSHVEVTSRVIPAQAAAPVRIQTRVINSGPSYEHAPIAAAPQIITHSAPVQHVQHIQHHVQHQSAPSGGYFDGRGPSYERQAASAGAIPIRARVFQVPASGDRPAHIKIIKEH